MTKVKVGINGYGTIGKRAAFAIQHMDDMEVVGVTKTKPSYEARLAMKEGLPLYAAAKENVAEFEKEEIKVAGTLDDLLPKCDIIVDATPGGIGEKYKAIYEKAGVKAIFQGGEAHGIAGISFNAMANYHEAWGAPFARVVSCNTTSIVRTLGALKKAGLLKKARGVLIRRATDPWESDRSGVMNTVVPEKTIPSHQSPDAQTVIPDLDVVTIAVVAAHTNCHLHAWSVELTRPTTKEEVLAAFRAAPRIAFLKMSEGVVALNSTLELMSDLGRPRGDMWEVGLWEDGLTVNGSELFYNYQVYNQAIVVPETIDAMRALTGVEKDGIASIAKTDAALGLVRQFVA